MAIFCHGCVFSEQDARESLRAASVAIPAERMEVLHGLAVKSRSEITSEKLEILRSFGYDEDWLEIPEDGVWRVDEWILTTIAECFLPIAPIGANTMGVL